MNRIEINFEVTSSTHTDFSIDATPYFQIEKDRTGHFIKGILDVGKDVSIEAWREVDAFLASMCVVGGGIFSRVIWDTPAQNNGIKWLSPPPQELSGTGIMVMETNSLDLLKKKQIIDNFGCILSKVRKDKDAFAVLSTYTVSNWFFNSQLIREAGVNYFSVVETIASICMPNTRNKAVYQLDDIYKAMELLHIEEKHKSIIKKAYGTRGELAHGHPKHLLLAQHVLNAHPMSSWSLKEPALICKQAADLFMESYFDFSGYFGSN